MTSPSVAVVGDNHLANAIREEVAEHFTITRPERAELVWFAEDMPVNESDVSDVEAIINKLAPIVDFAVAPHVAPILISTQVPVGFCATIEKRWPEHYFAIVPENVRKASARADFHHQARIIVGTRHVDPQGRIRRVLEHFTDTVLFMSPESAEMVKHLLNAWLACNIAFANDGAQVCEEVGASVEDVFLGFRSDARVGFTAPLRPGEPYTGGTLGRDVWTLRTLTTSPLIHGIARSNRRRIFNDTRTNGGSVVEQPQAGT